MKKGPKPKAEAERFWAKVQKTEECWLWMGAKASNYGHGKFGTMKAHRWAYENLIGPIPAGLVIDHLCQVPACVNPKHLEPVTQTENLRRQGARQTHCKRGNHPLSGENLYLDSRGLRHCKTCRNEASREYKKRKRSGGSTHPLLLAGKENSVEVHPDQLTIEDA